MSEPYELDDVAEEEGSFIEVPDQKSVEILKNMLRQVEKDLPETDRFPFLYLASVLELCNRALSIDPTYADFHVVKGDALVIARRFHEAIEEYDAASRLGATLLSIYNVKAYALAQKALILYILDPRNCEPWLVICDEVARLNPNVWQHYKFSLDINASHIRKSPSLTNNAFEDMGHEVKGRSPLSYGSQEYREVIAKYPEYFKKPAKD